MIYTNCGFDAPRKLIYIPKVVHLPLSSKGELNQAASSHLWNHPPTAAEALGVALRHLFTPDPLSVRAMTSSRVLNFLKYSRKYTSASLRALIKDNHGLENP